MKTKPHLINLILTGEELARGHDIYVADQQAVADSAWSSFGALVRGAAREWLTARLETERHKMTHPDLIAPQRHLIARKVDMMRELLADLEEG